MFKLNYGHKDIKIQGFKQILDRQDLFMGYNSDIILTLNKQEDLIILDNKYTLIDNEKMVWLEIMGKKRLLKLEWLKLAAHFELSRILFFKEDIFKIYFIDCHKDISNIGKLMIFPHPLTHPTHKDFRIVPNYVGYAINQNGQTIDTDTGAMIKTYSFSGKAFSYPSISIINVSGNLDRGRKTGIVVHRLVALAWVKNPDPIEKAHINHIDGDKINYHADNLEWVTRSENAQHALQNGLTNTQKKTLVRNLKTGEITEYPSYAEMKRQLGIKTFSSKFNPKVQIYRPIINGTYEIKTEDDPVDWTHKLISNQNKIQSSKYVTYITDKNTGEQKTYYTALELRNTYLRDIKGNLSLNQIIDRIKDKYPQYNVEYLARNIRKNIEIKDLKTGKVMKFSSLYLAAKHFQTSTTVIQRLLSRSPGYIYRNHLIKIDDGNAWPVPNMTVQQFDQARKVKIINILTNEKKYFSSLRETAIFFNVTAPIIKKYANNGKLLHGFMISIEDS